MTSPNPRSSHPASWNPVAFLRQSIRNSPWIVMAVALHLILLAVATVFYAAHDEAPMLDDGTTVKPVAPRVAEPKLAESEPEPRKPIPTNRNEELKEMPEVYIPQETQQSPTTAELGDPLDTSDNPPGLLTSGTAIGVGTKGQRGTGTTAIQNIRPHGIRGHGSLDGGTDFSTPPEKAVLAGLRWLARHQNEDGSWGATSIASRCDVDHPCSDPKVVRASSYDEGLTSLALLAYLGAGFHHDSKEFFKDASRGNQVVRTGDVVRKGLIWLKEHQNPDGSFGKDRPFLYNQALATMALCEAYGLTQNRIWREPAQRAVDYLQGAQRPSPTGAGLWGWRYASRQEIERFHQGDSLDEQFRKELYDSDTSVTGWAVMALKSARMSGLEVKQENLDGALAYAKWVSTGDGMAGYLDPKGAGAKVTGPDDQFDYHPAGMSALSMCIRAFTAHDVDDLFLEPAAKRLVADLPRVSKDKLSIDYYYWYYGSLALFQFDGPDSPRGNGKYWKVWNKAMVESVIDLQQKGGKDCGEGGWLVADRWCHSGGPIYATALNVLTLEVYYRYENAFSAGRKAKGAPPPPEGVK